MAIFIKQNISLKYIFVYFLNVFKIHKSETVHIMHQTINYLYLTYDDNHTEMIIILHSLLQQMNSYSKEYHLQIKNWRVSQD